MRARVTLSYLGVSTARRHRAPTLQAEECPSGVVTIAANTSSAGVVIYAALDNLLEGDEVFHLLFPSVGREVSEGFVLSTSAVSSEEVIILDTTSGIVGLSGLSSSVSEGTSVEFRVYLEGGVVAEDSDISVDWAVACNSSVSANDFEGGMCPSGTVTIAASASSGVFTVTLSDDRDVEDVETFAVRLTAVRVSGLDMVSVSDTSGVMEVSITDNDIASLSIETLSSSSVPEGGSFEFIVRLSDASMDDIVLPWRIDCSSSSGSDFAEEECPSGVVTIAANTLSASVVIYAASDNLLEGEEVFRLLLPSVGREVSEGFVLSTSAVFSEAVTISDTTSGLVGLSGLSSSVSEDTSVEFRVYLEGGVVVENKDISVDWAVVCDGNVSANDFAGSVCPSGTATIAASASSGVFTVSVLKDVEVEGVETFTVGITTVGASGLSVSLLGGGSSISVSITDNDAATLSIETHSVSSVPEGGSLDFIVRLSDASMGDIVLPWRIDCSSSSSGSDFAGGECPSGVVTIAANTLSAGVVIYAALDNLLEGDEVFHLLFLPEGREFPESFVLSTSAVSSEGVIISDTTSGIVGLSGLSSSVSEGASVEFRVYLEGGIVAENKDISVDWAVACNSSVSANDFAGEACPSGTATISASASVGTFTVNVLEDVEVEGVETFTVSITTVGASGLSVSLLGGGTSISVLIMDNDVASLSVETLSSSSVPEGESFEFIVRLSDASMGDIVLPWRVDCSSSSGSDFAGGECPSGVVTIAANTSTAGVVIYAASDNLLEGEEMFRLLLPSVGREFPEGFVLSTSAVSSEEVIISDATSGIVGLSGLSSRVSEGTSVEFRVYLEGGIVAENKDISVDWAVACNSSVSANDFAGEACPSGTATISASASVGTFTVNVLEDVEVEGVETFTVSITTVGASGLSVSLLGGGTSISVSITDNDAATLSIETHSVSSVPEGGSLDFIVRLSDASMGDIVLPWRIDCSSSSSGSDFAGGECPSGVVTIAANTSSAGVVIYAALDNLLEGDEVFHLLFLPEGREFPESFVLSTSAVSSEGVIISDTTSGIVGLSGLSSSVSEGASVEFRVYLEGGIVAEDSDISVDWAVICDASVSASDFEGSVCPSGTVTIAASGSSGTFTVSVLEDVEVEGVETFTVSITTVGASGLSVSLLGGGTSISVSITDNDAATLSIETHSVSSVPEGGSLDFIVRLSDASMGDIVLPWRIDCSSSSGSDFAGGECPSGVVTIAANTSSASVVIYAASDNLLEGEEMFRLLLLPDGREFPEGFVLSTSAVSSEEVTISDTTSGLVGLSGLSSSVSEGASVEFRVYLEGGIVAEDKDISVDWAVACNSSVSANDFAGEACPSGTATISASASVGTFTVNVLEDVEVEGVENFTVSITTVGASGLSVSLLGSGTSISVSITDNDAATLSIETHSVSSVPEGGSLDFIVRLSDASMGDIVLPWRIDCSSSSSGSDFAGGECPSGVVTIAANTLSAGVVIYAALDNLLEGDEVFHLLFLPEGREFPESFVLSTSAVSSEGVIISDTTSGIVGLSGLSSSVSEGASVEFRVYLEGGIVAEDSDISVDWAVICDASVSASDFEGSVCPSGTVTIAASGSSGTFTVSVLEDVEVEGVETFTVSITTVGASGLSVSLLGGGTSISVSITDNDAATLSIETHSVSSVPEGGSLDFIVRLSDASMGDIVLPWRIDCSSSSGSDFAGGECPSGVVTIAANTSSASVVIYAASDNLLEGEEMFRLLLLPDGREFPEGFVLSTSAVSSEEVTISDTTSGLVGLSGLSSSVSEGASVEFGVYLEGGVVAEEEDISVDWAVICDGTVSANDFEGGMCPSGTATIAAGESSGVFTVTLSDDRDVEGVETFAVRLTAVRVPGLDMVSVSDTSGVMEVSITDNDVASLSVETDLVSSALEGGSLEFIVRLSDASMGDIVLPWRIDCSSSSGSDFAGGECPSGVVTIAANTSSAGVVIYVASDNLLEGEEMFRLLLPSVGREFPEGFVLSTSAVFSEGVTISDTTSGIVGLSGLLSSVSEGASVEFSVYLEGGVVAEDSDISVDWAVICDGSVSANDFAGSVCPSGTVTIAAGESSGVFTVTLSDDRDVESVETFAVRLTAVRVPGLDMVSVSDTSGVMEVSITDNDVASLSVETDLVSSALEGGSFEFIVRLSDASMGDIVLPWRVDCSSSSSGSDFAGGECPSGVVTIAANTSSAGVVIYAASDNLLEGEEMFRLLLPSVGREVPEGFVLSTSAVSSEEVTISDTTSGIVELSGLSSNVSEGASVEFGVYLEGGVVAEDSDISVDWAVACNSSVSANDFAGSVCPSGTVTIAAGESSGVFTVTLSDDRDVEDVETFAVRLTAVRVPGLDMVSVSDTSGVMEISITDNDVASLSVETLSSSSVPEGGSFEFIVRLSDASMDDIVLPWRIDCSSSSGSDFAEEECPSGVVTIVANTSSAGVVIYAASDNLLEGEEMFRLLLPSVGREVSEGFVLSTSAVSSEEVIILDTTSGIVGLSGLSSSVSEGTSVEFRVYLEGGVVAEDSDISVDWAVACNSSVSANDFEGGMCPSGTVTIAASASSGVFTVTLSDDRDVEDVETFAVRLTAVRVSGLDMVSVSDTSGVMEVSITDNDIASLSIETLSSSSVPEGGSFEFIVRLSDASMDDIVLPWRIDCSSSSGSDFAEEECPSGVVTIAANTLSASVVIYAASDNLLEGEEVFRLLLPSVGREVSEGFVLSTSAVFSEAVTISDTTSGLVGLSGLSSSVSEDTSVEFRVYLEGGVVVENKDISVDWAVVCDGNVSANDFAGSVCPSGTATIAASASSGVFTVSVLKDVEVEGVETFTVGITTVGASGLSVSLLGGGSSISVSITDNDAATLSIETHSVSSVPEGGSLDFIVRLSDASMGDIVLPWRIDCSSSSSGSDFAGGECPSGVVTIAANTLSAGVVIYAALDNLLEGDEVFHLLFLPEGREFPESFVLSTSAVSSEGVIISDTTSGIVGLSGLSSSVSEGASVEFRVYLEGGIVAENKDISVDWAVACNSSVSANDFAGEACPSGTATISASASVGTFTVNVLEDVEVEGVETFTVSITTVGASGLSVSLLGGGTSISVLIMDNDVASLSVETLSSSSVPEGESFEFIVRLSDASMGDIVLPWRVDCSSSSGSDFAGGECPSGVVTIAANTSTAGVVIYAASDNLLEGEEMFRLLLPSVGREFPEGFVLSTSAVSSEEVIISDATSGIVGLSGLSSRVSEGTSVEFRVYLEGGIVAENKDISVDWAVACNSSVSANDFAGEACPSGTATISASASVGTFTVNVLEDVEVEGVETFTVSITTVGASGLSVSLLGGGTSISVSITDNDAATLSIETHSVSSVPEGGSLDFIVRLSDASMGDIVLPWRIDCSSSSSGSDFAGGECPSGVVTIAANTSSAGVVIYAALDNLLEGDEVFHLLFLPEGREFPESFVLSTSAVSSEGVIISDTTSGIVGLSGLSSSVSEGASVEFRVYLEGGIVAEDSDISVDWAVICDASVSASDFEGSVCPSGTVTIAASGSSGTFTVSVLEDVEVEGVETFTVSITTVGASGLSVSLLGGGTSISVSITDNDAATLSIETHSVSSVPEGGSLDFIVRLSDASMGDIVLPWRIDCSSSSGSDFAGGECPSGVVTIAANTSSASVVIYAASDNLLEGEEMFRLLLLPDGREFPEGFVLSTSAVSSEEVTISDTTSGLVGLSGLSSSVSEGASVEFRVYLEGGIVAEDKDISVDWAVACNSSVSANDFAGEACPSGTATISASASVGTFTVNVLEDVEVEGVENFTVSITTVGASGLSVSLLGSGTSISVSITDNDAATLSIETHSVSSVPEGGSLDFIVRLSDASMGDIVLPWRIDCSSSSSGSDFAGGECPSGVVTIAANTLSAGVVIYAALDNLLEGDEVFHLLFLPEGREFPESFVLSTSAVSSEGVIISDTTSGIVGLSGLSSSVSEGASVEFRVYLEGGIVAEDSDISVDWAVICDASVSASDFEGSVCPSGTVTIAASGSSGTFTVSVLEDVEVEGVETFTVSITTVGASGLSVSLLGGGTSISVSITDNDAATLSIETHSVSSVPEGGSLDFIVRLSDARHGRHCPAVAYRLLVVIGLRLCRRGVSFGCGNDCCEHLECECGDLCCIG